MDKLEIAKGLVFLGPAFGAVVTSLYAMREGRRQTALQLHTSHSDRRLDIALEFLDALNACSEHGTVEEETKTATALAAVSLKVQLAFADTPAVTTAAAEATRWASTRAQNPAPPPDPIPHVLRQLEELGEQASNPEYATKAKLGLKYVKSINDQLNEAADKGETGPDIGPFEDGLVQLSSTLWGMLDEDEVNLFPVLLEPSVRRERRMHGEARAEADAGLAQERARFVKAAGAWLVDPPRPSLRSSKRWTRTASGPVSARPSGTDPDTRATV
ncbi:hypothetical protein ACFV1C_00065 [Streptomyces sp. NPDC059605]|uniref:hypothetical protein n=1 Tax=Streptomyces sp. NPDC059605 TaxID=3346882 RepID=UPI0036B6DB07